MSTLQIDFGTTDRVVGIDLGTTNSLVAYTDATGPKIIPGPAGPKLAPSIGSINARGGHASTPTEIADRVLRRLKSVAGGSLGEPVTTGVITVRAYFNNALRQATKDAGRIAGLEVLRLVGEPTAASVAYGLDKR